ncbi:MAG: hypothetical protein RLZZ126_721 [Pseudomonadota bacterium]|jgi:glyoxylate/hydroxypyruvate reductase
MNILFCFPRVQAEPWVAELRKNLPDARIEVWQAAAVDPLMADYGVVWAPPQAFIDEQSRAPGSRMKALFNLGAGVDALMQLDLPAHLPVVRLQDAGMGPQMVEYVLHAVARHVRELDVYEAALKSGDWPFRKPRARADFPVGVLGLGVLGSQVAQALHGLGYPVNGWSQSPKQMAGVQCFHGAAGLDDFLAATRILVCLLPLTPQTENVLNASSLGRLQAGAYVINVARGGHVVDADLIALLDSGHLAGAMLDVFRTEPLPSEHPFWRHPKITLTPHISARTLRSESLAQIAGKIQALERGDALDGVVNRSRGY